MLPLFPTSISCRRIAEIANTLPSLAQCLNIIEKLVSHTSTFALTWHPGILLKKNLLAFGTDDGKVSVKALEEAFDFAVHLLCERHMQNTTRGSLRHSQFLRPIKHSFSRIPLVWHLTGVSAWTG